MEVARTINALTDDQRAPLGIVHHDPAHTYDRVDRLFNKLCGALEAGHVADGARVDAKWLANLLAAAAVPAEFRTSRSVAVDGTDVETWGVLHGDPFTIELDGEAAETQPMDDGSVPKPKKPARKALVLGVGADGRKQYTVDPDARAGHRSATNGRPGPTSATSCTLPCRPATCAGPTGPTPPGSPRRSPASSPASRSCPPAPTGARPS